MRVVHFNYHDRFGGAAKTVYDLHTSLKKIDCDSKLLVVHKTFDDDDIIAIGDSGFLSKSHRQMGAGIRKMLEYYYKPNDAFGFELAPRSMGALYPHIRSADIIHLHWTNMMLTARRVRDIWETTKAPIVWTFLDAAPFTGGCHYTHGCSRFEDRCGICPQINSNHIFDASRWNWWNKSRHLAGVPITVVAATAWVARHVELGSLFSHESVTVVEDLKIAIDENIFRPLERSLAKKVLAIPEDRRYIFCGARNFAVERKGFGYLVEALEHICDMSAGEKRLPALIVAAEKMPPELGDLPLETYNVGFLMDNRSLALAYQAADVFVCPSIDDAGPLMVAESIMCGTPVVGFDTGGFISFIESGKTGYRAAYKDGKDLADRIIAVLNWTCDEKEIISRCRESAMKMFSTDIVARQYLSLYENLVRDKGTK